MPNDFADPNFLVGLKDPLEQPAPDTANRSLGRVVADTGAILGESALSFARIPTTVMRNLSDDPNGNAAAIDRALGGAQESLREAQSPRAQAIQTNKWMPGPGERSAWNEPVTTAATQALGLVPSIAVGAATGGGGLAGLGLFGAQGATDALTQVQDYTDTTPLAELNKLEPFRAAMREFNGNEAAARRKLFQDSVDVWDVAINFAANAAEFGAVMHAMTPAKKELVSFLNKNFIRRGGVGATEGFAGGAAEGLASETTQQRAKVKMGVQPDVDVAEILGSGFETGVAMAPGVAGLHMARRGPRVATPLNTDITSTATAQTQAIQTTAPPPAAPAEQYGPENMFGPFQPPPAAGGPAGPAGGVPPSTPPGPTPGAGPAPAAGAAPPAATQSSQPATPPGVVTDPAAAATVGDPTAAAPTPTSQAAAAPPAAQSQAGQQAPVTSGVSAPSTFYVDPTTFNDEPLRIMAATGGPAREVAFDEATGRWGVRLLEGPKAGQFHPKLYFDAETAPRPGLAPVGWAPGQQPTFGELIEEPGVAALPATADAPVQTADAPPRATDVPPLTPEEQAEYDRLTAEPAAEPPTPIEQDVARLVADEPRVATPAPAPAPAPAADQLTAEEQAAFDAEMAKEDTKPAPQRDKRRKERQAVRKEREAQPAMTDAEIIERAKTEDTKRVEAAAREAREREAAVETAAAPATGTTLGERQSTGDALEEARRRVFAKQEADADAQAAVDLQQLDVEQLARGPRARVQVLANDIRDYKRAPSADRYRQLRGRVMTSPVGVRDRLTTMLGEQPTTAEDKARAQPKAGAGPNQRKGVFKLPLPKGVPATVAAKPAVPVTQRTAGEQHDTRLDELSKHKNLPPLQFFRNLEVIKTLADLRELRRMQRSLEPARQMPLPLWLKEKYDALDNPNKNFSFVAEGTPYIKAAQTLKNRPKRSVTPDTKRAQRSDQTSARQILETREGRKLAEEQAQRQRREARIDRTKVPELTEIAIQERLPARQRLIRRRQRLRDLFAENLVKVKGLSEAEAKLQAEKQIPLLRTHEEGRGKRKRKVTERLPTPAELPALVVEYIEEHIDQEASAAAAEKSRATRYRARERAINHAWRNVMNKVGGQAAFVRLLQQARGYTRDERQPETLPDGKPNPRAWRAVASEYPKTPKVLERRATQTNRQHQDTIDRYADLEKAHQDRVAEYWRAKAAQLHAINRLQPMIDDMLNETDRLFGVVKDKLNIKGRSIFFEMPKVKIEETIGDQGQTSRRMRITVGKAGSKANMFKTMVELFKANEQLKIIRKATASNRFNQPDIVSTISKTAEAAQEMRSYMRRMETVADVVGLDLTSWLDQDFSAMLERIKLRSDRATERFNQLDPTTIKQEGEYVDLSERLAGRIEYDDDTRVDSSELAVENVPNDNIYDPDRPNPMDQLSIEEAAFEQAAQDRSEKAAAAAARALQIDRMRAMVDQAKAVNDPAKVAKLQELIAKVEALLDKHNGNRRTSPAYGDAPQSIKEVAREIADARTELDELDPDSPLISNPEHAAETMDRVKGLIASGKAAISSFVSPAFLDKLANVVVDVPVIHTTSDVTNGRMYYQIGHNRIVLLNDVSAQHYVQGAVHEAVHAVTEDLLETDAAFRDEATLLLSRARAHAKRTGADTGSRDLFGLKDVNEFLAEAISNPAFRQFLNHVPTPGVSPIRGLRTALNGFYRVIRDAWQRVMGTKRDADTALDVLFYDQSEVLGRAEKLVTRSVAQLRREQRMPKLGMGVRTSPATDRFGAALKEGGLDALEKIKRTRDNLQRDRGLGLSIHSTYDLTTRAEPAFREKTSDVLDVASMIYRERTRMLQEEDQPVLLKVNKFMNALAPAKRKTFEDLLIDETMLGAFIDAPLFVDKNRHINQHSLADEQVRQQWGDMNDRWKEFADTEAEVTDDKGKKTKVTAASIRDEAHKYFADRENQIREVVIKHTLERSDILPDTLTAAQHDAALNRMIEYIFPKKAMSDDDLQEFRKKERAALKADYGIDLSNRAVREQIADLRNEDALKRIDGPYFPLTRHGDYAVHGVFRIATPDNATRYPEKVHWQTKRPIDDGTFLFNDIDDARDFIRSVSDEYGISQIGGGDVWIDTRTGERVMEYTPRELEVERELAEARKTPEPRNRRLRRKEIEEGVKKGKPYVRKFEVKMQNRILEYHANEADAQASINEWKARHPAVLDINAEPEDVRKGTGKENEQYVSQQMQRVIDRFEGSRSYRAQSDADQKALKHALTQAAAKSVMRRGVRARFTTRNYVKGASRDVMRNMADYSGSTAGYLAKMKHMTQIDEKTKGLRDYVYDQRDAKGHQARTRVTEELLERLHEPTQSMVETPFSRAVDRILKFTMFDKLMGLGYFAINATEPTLIAGPLMAGKHSAAAIAREIRTAYGMYGALKFAGYGARDFWKAARNQRNYTDYQTKFLDAIRGKNDEQELLGLYNHLTKLGLFEATAGVEYQRLLMLHSQGKIDQAGDYLTNMFQGMNTAVENLSRFVTATAAYRLERKAGRSEAEALKYARDMVYEAHGQYANFNAPELFNRNPVFKLALQFKKYPQRIAANYIRAISGSLGAVKALTQGKKPSEEQMMRARQFGMMLAMQGMAAGVMGMPTEPFSIPINALHILGIVPFNWDDVEAYSRKQLADAVGPTGGELISHGVLRLLPFDVSGRLSQNSMLIYGSPGSTKVQDLQKSAFGIVAGAGGSWVAELIGAAQKGSEAVRAYSDGATDVGNKKAVEAFKLGVPVRAVADIVDAIQRSTPEGMQNQRGAQMREPYNIAEAIGAVAGFRPTRESEQMEQRRTVQRATTVYGRERKEIIDHWAQSDASQRASQLARIDQWNSGRPKEQWIKREDLLRALNVRTKATKQDPAALGLNTDKRTQSFLDQTKGVYNY